MSKSDWSCIIVWLKWLNYVNYYELNILKYKKRVFKIPTRAYFKIQANITLHIRSSMKCVWYCSGSWKFSWLKYSGVGLLWKMWEATCYCVLIFLMSSFLMDCFRSDGAQPHLVNIQFQKKVKLQLVVLYVDFKLDESYTPSKISIRAGDGFHNLKVDSYPILECSAVWVVNDSIKLFCSGSCSSINSIKVVPFSLGLSYYFSP